MKKLLLFLIYCIVLIKAHSQNNKIKSHNEQSTEIESGNNLGGVISGSPAQAKVYQGPAVSANNSRAARTNKSFQDQFKEMTKDPNEEIGIIRKPAASVPMSSIYTSTRYSSSRPNENMDTTNTSTNFNRNYVYILFVFFLFLFFFFYRNAIKKILIILLSKFYYVKSKDKNLKKADVKESLNLKDKLSSLKELEILYSTGVINEAEFNKLKSEIIN